MANLILFDDETRKNLLPLTFTRPLADIRVGILTIREKWEKYFATDSSTITEDYLFQKFPLKIGAENLLINGSVCPNAELFEEIKKLKIGRALVKNGTLVAALVNMDSAGNFKPEDLKKNGVECASSFRKINNSWEIFVLNGEEIAADFKLITSGRKSAAISNTNTVIASEQVFVEEGARIECAVLNASGGPIYIGKDAEVMEGSLVRGPFSLGEHSALKLGAKIYGPTTIGPHSKVGGEVNNSVIFGYSNKAHDGFLGNSVLGEWCNIGADSNNSNLKNNYEEVKLWSYVKNRFEKTGLQFCGLIMGDHSKCGINTMFNTGTVVGVSCNIFGPGFPRNFVPCFSWGGASGFTTYQTEKAFEVAEKVFERRNLIFNQAEKDILSAVFNLTEQYRK